MISFVITGLSNSRTSYCALVYESMWLFENTVKKLIDVFYIIN